MQYPVPHGAQIRVFTKAQPDLLSSLTEATGTPLVSQESRIGSTPPQRLGVDILSLGTIRDDLPEVCVIDH